MNPINEKISPEEALALIKYMADHNAHHAEELREAMESVPEKSFLLLQNAITELEHSTEIIKQAIAVWEE